MVAWNISLEYFPEMVSCPQNGLAWICALEFNPGAGP
jgi:hypothetical protein